MKDYGQYCESIIQNALDHRRIMEPTLRLRAHNSVCYASSNKVLGVDCKFLT